MSLDWRHSCHDPSPSPSTVTALWSLPPMLWAPPALTALLPLHGAAADGEGWRQDQSQAPNLGISGLPLGAAPRPSAHPGPEDHGGLAPRSYRPDQPDPPA